MARQRGRKSRQIAPPKRVLILCEGETEVVYFKSYVSEGKHRRRLSGIVVDVYQPKKYTPLELVKEAKRRQQEGKKGMPYQSVWVVFDKDIHPHLPEAFRLAKEVSIQVAFSSVCFEYWILLHLECTTKPFANCAKIERYIQKQHYSAYKKGRENFFHHIKKDIDKAVECAAHLQNEQQKTAKTNQMPYEFNPYTDVHQLVVYLKSLSD